MLFVLAKLQVFSHDFLYQHVKAFYVGDNFVGDVPLSKKVLAALTTGENMFVDVLLLLGYVRNLFNLC